MFPGKNGSFTLSAALFQETWPEPQPTRLLQTTIQCTIAFQQKLHRFTWESLFVPLSLHIDLLKFSW
ncbi:hypothetical protein ACHAWX_000182 [Stephanocyclus meneghinianus]